MRLNLAVQNAVTGSAAACLEIIAGFPRACFLMEVDITLTAATQSEFGLGYPAAKGITPTLLQFSGPGDPQSYFARAAVAWGTPPTAPTRFMRRQILQNVIGQSLQWLFDDFKSDKPNGVLIAAGTSVVIWNLSTVAISDISIVVEEKWAN